MNIFIKSILIINNMIKLLLFQEILYNILAKNLIKNFKKKIQKKN